MSNRKQIYPLKFESSEIQVFNDEQGEIIEEQQDPIEYKDNILEAVSNISMGIEDKSLVKRNQIEKNDNLIDDKLINQLDAKIKEMITLYGHVIDGDDKNNLIM